MKKYARFAALAALFLLVIYVCAAAEKPGSPEGSEQTMEKTTVFTGSDGEAYDPEKGRRISGQRGAAGIK